MSRYAIGVDFGTGSGRAILVDVADGTPTGDGRRAVSQRRHRRAPARSDGDVGRCRPTGRSRIPTTTCGSSRRPSPRCCAPPAWIRPTSSASGSTSRPARCCRPRPTARRSAELPGLPGRTRTPGSSSGSTTPPSPRPTGSTRSRARPARPGSTATAGRSRPSGSSRRRSRSSTRRPRSTPRRTGCIEAADWVVWRLTGVETRNACTAGYKAMWSKRDGFPDAGLLRRARPAASPTSSTRRCRATSVRSGERAGGLTAEAAALDGPAGRDRGRGRQRRRARRRARRRPSPRPGRW